jgi:hypothetical protein
MTKLSFFHQKRKDEAVRTGVEVDSDLVLERFVPGDGENDSALVWYIDVRCTTESAIEADAETVRSFFLDLAGPIGSGLRSAAEDLRAGLDADLWPIRRPIQSMPRGVHGEIVCSAMRRVTDGELSRVLQNLADVWAVTLTQLPEVVAPLD